MINWIRNLFEPDETEQLVRLACALLLERDEEWQIRESELFWKKYQAQHQSGLTVITCVSPDDTDLLVDGRQRELSKGQAKRLDIAFNQRGSGNYATLEKVINRIEAQRG